MMRLFSSFLTLSFLLVGPLTTAGQLTPDDAAAPALGGQDDSSPLGFYETRPDYYRKCPSPYCGGVFLRPIDGSLITCPGSGATAEEPTPEAECYVGAIRYSPMLDEPPPLSGSEIATGLSILYGRIVPGNYENAPHVHDFEVQDGRIAAASQPMILSYRVQHDDGGFWLDSLTTNMTLCSNGVLVQESCFVAQFNLAGLGLTTPEEEQAVLDYLYYGESGRVVQGYYIENPEYENTNWSKEKDLFVVQVTVPAS
jgi:hypothetical protein